MVPFIAVIFPPQRATEKIQNKIFKENKNKLIIEKKTNIPYLLNSIKDMFFKKNTVDLQCFFNFCCTTK